MSSSFSFDIQHRDPQTVARTGLLTTAHGTVRTPAFVGVATRATIKALEPQALVDIGLQIVISNTYHLHLQPGEDVIASLGGLHGFSGWDHPTMTDSGGFQVFSLGASKDHGVGKVASIFPGNKVSAKPKVRPSKPLVKLTEQGVDFRSILDGSPHTFTPESVITIERKLGADIIVPLDECTSPLHDHAYTKNSMERTHRWARRGLAAFQLLKDDPTFPNPDQVLYGIVQGGAYHDLRLESARFIGDMAFDGFAIGGSLGRSKSDMWNVLDWSIPLLRDEAPRHLLGIGEIEDLFTCVARTPSIVLRQHGWHETAACFSRARHGIASIYETLNSQPMMNRLIPHATASRARTIPAPISGICVGLESLPSIAWPPYTTCVSLSG